MTNFYDIILNGNYNPQLKLIKSTELCDDDSSIEGIVNMLVNLEDLNRLYVERCYVVGLNDNNKIVGVYMVSSGDMNSCNVYNKSIITFLLLCGATNFILFHNHPCDSLEASNEDICAETSLSLLAKQLDLRLIDSVIICKCGWICIESGEGCVYDDENEE